MTRLPEPHVLHALAGTCRRAEIGDRRIDCLAWVELGWTVGGNDDVAWRRGLPRAPDLFVNASDMTTAIRHFPDDMAGIARGWNVPLLSTSVDAAEMLLGEPETTFVWSTRNDFGGLRRVHVFDGGEIVVNADAATMPLAILAAALEASALRIERGLGLPERR
jgi:hypothetical protein